MPPGEEAARSAQRKNGAKASRKADSIPIMRRQRCFRLPSQRTLMPAARDGPLRLRVLRHPGIRHTRDLATQRIHRGACRKEDGLSIRAAKHEIGRDFWRANDAQAGAIWGKDPRATRTGTMLRISLGYVRPSISHFLVSRQYGIHFFFSRRLGYALSFLLSLTTGGSMRRDS